MKLSFKNGFVCPAKVIHDFCRMLQAPSAPVLARMERRTFAFRQMEVLPCTSRSSALSQDEQILFYENILDMENINRNENLKDEKPEEKTPQRGPQEMADASREINHNDNTSVQSNGAASEEVMQNVLKNSNTQLEKLSEATRFIHGDVAINHMQTALVCPIFPTSTYAFRNTQQICDYWESKINGDIPETFEYGRYDNPTVNYCEERLRVLDEGEASVLLPNGMSAITFTLLTLLKSGDHIICGDECYKKTRTFCREWLSKFGIETTEVQVGDPEAIKRALKKTTKIIILESPTNPYLRITDLEAVSEIAKAHGIITFIDSTFASPVNQKPLQFGIDIVNHSCTKYLGGHNDLFAGVVTGKKEIVQKIRDARGTLGGMIDAEAAWRLERSLKTLLLRVKHQNDSAYTLARALEAHPKIEKVWYPGLESHPDHETAKRQMKGFGGVFSLEIKGGKKAASQFIDALKLTKIAISFGGPESLAVQHRIISYYTLSAEEVAKIGVKENLVRYSVGLEDTNDLLQDIQSALENVVI
jgi:cystathionine gamma-synthase